MLSNERLLTIIKAVEIERCNQIMDEYSCGDNSDCKGCRMKALSITDDEYLYIFGED